VTVTRPDQAPQGSAAAANVKVEIVDQRTGGEGKQGLSVQESTSGLERLVRVVVTDMAADGGLDKPIRARFGLRPAPV
jgi:hypothetical protein